MSIYEIFRNLKQLKEKQIQNSAVISYGRRTTDDGLRTTDDGRRAQRHGNMLSDLKVRNLKYLLSVWPMVYSCEISKGFKHKL